MVLVAGLQKMRTREDAQNKKFSPAKKRSLKRNGCSLLHKLAPSAFQLKNWPCAPALAKRWHSTIRVSHKHSASQLSDVKSPWEAKGRIRSAVLVPLLPEDGFDDCLNATPRAVAHDVMLVLLHAPTTCASTAELRCSSPCGSGSEGVSARPASAWARSAGGLLRSSFI